MGQNHSHGNVKGFRLGLSIFLNVLITVLQVAGGLISGSLALLTDALHNFSDVLALIISWMANKLSIKSFTSSKTYGYKRAQIIAAMFNSGTLIVIAAFLIKEAVFRILNPGPIQSDWVIVLAGASIVFNGICVLLLKEDSKHNLNMRSAYLHLFTDMMTSVAVMAGGIAMRYSKLYWIDSVLSIGIALYLVFSGYSLLISTLKILMQFTPEEIDPQIIQSKLTENKNIKNIHHLHIWQLDDDSIHLEGHVDFNEDLKLSAVQRVLTEIKQFLRKEFKITHFSLQPGLGCCADTNLIAQHEHHIHSS